MCDKWYGVSKDTLFKQLIADRNHHFSHPQTVNLKAGVTATTLVISLVIAVMTESITSPPSCWASTFFISGLLLGTWGLIEHNRYHVRQRRRLEMIIDKIFVQGNSVEDVLQKSGPKDLDAPNISIFVSEPDLRSFFRNHDFKIFFGIGLLIIGAIIFAGNIKLPI